MPVSPLDDVPSGDSHWLRVALDVPLRGLFDYCSPQPVAPGTRVIVPFGRRRMVGMVVQAIDQPEIDPALVKPIAAVLDDTPPMSADWMRLCQFAAQYYQRPLGEVMMPALPGSLRKPAAYEGKRSAGGPVARLEKRLARQRGKKDAGIPHDRPSQQNSQSDAPPALNASQAAAVRAITAAEGHQTLLLHGVTGSGKTEVYLHAAAEVLARGRQVLFMVPEINLTPQLQSWLHRRLGALAGEEGMAVMHSGLAEGERLQAWLDSLHGRARVLLGTRMSVFAPLPELGLIIIDEEHDTSYKQQDGLRYSARDLAIWRAHDLKIPVVLGSATPAFETWHHAHTGRYQYLSLPDRARVGAPPAVKLVDTRRLALEQGFSPQLLEAIDERLLRREQVLVFINRRGYAPVLNCHSCAWLSQCPRCTAYTVLHRMQPRRHHLQCHHCGYQAPVPRACPECGDHDLKPMGRGTQRIEEFLTERYPEARIARIDADSTRLKGSAESLFARVHAGEVDILVGTQMVAKGHDFTRLGLVGVLNADAALFAQDFRAPERLFAQLMQVAGRAGRHVEGGEVIVQTDYPEQAVYQALRAHDYPRFARHSLEEREAVGLPPYAYQALLTAEARELSIALAFLTAARELAVNAPDIYSYVDQLTLYDPVPLRMVRVANVERAQLLIEGLSRPALQGFLSAWSETLPDLARQHKTRCHLEVDPLEI